jgi:hypothetical protein
MPRTVEEFVADCLARGKTAAQVLAIAQNTRWNDNLDEVKALLEKGKKKSIRRRKNA